MNHSSFAVVLCGGPLVVPFDQLLQSNEPGLRVARGSNYLALAEAGVAIHTSPEGALWLSEGYATINKGLVSGAPLAAAIANGTVTRRGQQSYSYVRCGFSASKAGTDWLGLRQVYFSTHRHRHTPQHYTIISNDLSWHSRLLCLMGETAAVDGDSLLMLAAAGASLTPATSIEGVTLLAGYDTVSVGADGKPWIDKGQRVSRELLSAEPGALLALAAEEVRDNVQAALRAYPTQHHVLELTGGADSRLQLAAALATGETERFSCTTRGSAESRDRQIAARILSAVRVRACNGPEQFEDASPDQHLEAARRCGGMRSTFATHLFARTRHGDRLVYTGGNGETFRAPYAYRALKRNLTTPDELDRPATARAASALIRRVLFGQRVLWSSRDAALTARIRELCQGLPRQSLGDTLQSLYTDFRNRFHFGLFAASRAETLPCIQPLQSEAAIAYSLTLPAEHRAQTVVTFRLIEALFPGLLLLPFDDFVLPNAFLAGKLWGAYARNAAHLNADLEPLPSIPAIKLPNGTSISGMAALSNLVVTVREVIPHLSSKAQEALCLGSNSGLFQDPAEPAARDLARSFGGQVLWAYWLDRVNASTPDRLLKSLVAKRPMDVLGAD